MTCIYLVFSEWVWPFGAVATAIADWASRGGSHYHRVQTTAADWIEANLEGGAVVKEKFVGGSNWSSAYVYTTQQGKEYFVKLAMGGRDDSMFQGEAQGLNAMYGECVTRWDWCWT